MKAPKLNHFKTKQNMKEEKSLSLNFDILLTMHISHWDKVFIQDRI